MPIAEHRQVAASARRAGLSKRKTPERYNAYVYGTLNKIDKARKAKRRGNSGGRVHNYIKRKFNWNGEGAIPKSLIRKALGQKGISGRLRKALNAALSSTA